MNNEREREPFCPWYGFTVRRKGWLIRRTVLMDEGGNTCPFAGLGTAYQCLMEVHEQPVDWFECEFYLDLAREQKKLQEQLRARLARMTAIVRAGDQRRRLPALRWLWEWVRQQETPQGD